MNEKCLLSLKILKNYNLILTKLYVDLIIKNQFCYNDYKSYEIILNKNYKLFNKFRISIESLIKWHTYCFKYSEFMILFTLCVKNK